MHSDGLAFGLREPLAVLLDRRFDRRASLLNDGLSLRFLRGRARDFRHHAGVIIVVVVGLVRMTAVASVAAAMVIALRLARIGSGEGDARHQRQRSDYPR